MIFTSLKFCYFSAGELRKVQSELEQNINSQFALFLGCQTIINGLQQLSFACMFVVVVFEEGSVVIPTQVLKRSERNEKGYVVILHVCVHCSSIVVMSETHIGKSLCR